MCIPTLFWYVFPLVCSLQGAVTHVPRRSLKSVDEGRVHQGCRHHGHVSVTPEPFEVHVNEEVEVLTLLEYVKIVALIARKEENDEIQEIV